MKTLKTKIVSVVDSNGYFVEPCFVNEDPLSDKEEWILPKNAILVEPPKEAERYANEYRFKYDVYAKKWIKELNRSYTIEYNEKLFSINLLNINILNLLIYSDYEEYKIPDIDKNQVLLSKDDLVNIRKIVARRVLMQKGYNK